MIKVTQFVLKDYIPEKVSHITGVQPHLIRTLARDIAGAKAVTIVSNQTFGKFYHGSLIERAELIVLALGGHLGKKGSGFNAICLWTPDGAGLASIAPSRPSLTKAVQELESQMSSRVEELRKKGYSGEMIAYELEREGVANGASASGTLFFYLHGGVKELSSGSSQRWDPYLKQEAEEYVKEALKKGWQFINPPPDKDPLIFISEGGNILRRVRGYTSLIENLLPKLRLIVNIDWRMSTTGLYSDFILPCATWYEKDDLRWGMVIPHIHITHKAVEPLGESKPEWEIHCLLAKKIQQRANQRGILNFKDSREKERSLGGLYNELTFNGTYTEGETEKLINDLIKA